MLLVSSNAKWLRLRAVAILTCLAAGMTCVRSRSRVDSYRSSAEFWMRAAEEAHDALSARRFELIATERDVEALERRNRILAEEAEGGLAAADAATESGGSSEEAREVEVGPSGVGVEMSDASRVAELERDIQVMSLREAIERFGDGPHYVRFELDFPHEGDDSLPASPATAPASASSSSSFLVELAPLSQMPHSVRLFLEQVSRGLWDGCAFDVRAPHLVKAGPPPPPLPRSGPSAQAATTTVPTAAARRRTLDKVRSFSDAGLAGPFFPEYSPHYPHRVHTLGFVAHPDAGPGFYVNTRDNSEAHAAVMDPCFGRVVEGAEAIDKLNRMEVVEDGGIIMREAVGIVSAKILPGPRDIKKQNSEGGKRRNGSVVLDKR